MNIPLVLINIQKYRWISVIYEIKHFIGQQHPNELSDERIKIYFFPVARIIHSNYNH